MTLGCISTLALVGVAIAAGLGHFSFWWVLIPAFLAGSFSLANGPWHERIIEANQQGQLGFFPMMLLSVIVVQVAVAAGAYWIARAFSG